MAHLAHRRQGRREPLFDGTHGRVRRLGDGALDFTKWFLRSKYRLMASFLGELEQAPDARDEAALRTRYCKALTHAERVLTLRGVVTVLLALGAATATVSAVSDALAVGGGALKTIAAWSASLTLLLILLRLAFDRYLSLVDVSATFLAMQIASARPARP